MLPASLDRPSQPFRRFSSIAVPGYASELAFFRQTIAVVTEKAFVIAEPGNTTTNSIPTFPSALSQTATVVRMVNGAKPMAMYQIAENEFLLVYDWGACFVTKCKRMVVTWLIFQTGRSRGMVPFSDGTSYRRT